eukprot:s2191_g11.t1
MFLDWLNFFLVMNRTAAPWRASRRTACCLQFRLQGPPRPEHRISDSTEGVQVLPKQISTCRARAGRAWQGVAHCGRRQLCVSVNVCIGGRKWSRMSFSLLRCEAIDFPPC